MSIKSNSRIEFSNLSYKSDETTLNKYFSRYGQIEKLILFRDDQDQSLREGFLIYKNSESVDELMNERPHSIDARQIFVRRSIPNKNSSSFNLDAISSQLVVKELFISRLLFAESKEFFVKYFQRFGKIVDCRVFHFSSSNRNKSGYGFVRFDDYDSVDRAILSRPHVINSRFYSVRKSIPREYCFISSSIKPLSFHKPNWRHFALGLINLKTETVFYPTRPKSKIEKIPIVQVEEKEKVSANDFEIIGTTDSLTSSISIVDSSTDDFAVISPVFLETSTSHELFSIEN